MSFVGGSGNIAIATALSTIIFLNCIVNIRQSMELIHLYARLRPRFLNVEINPGPWSPVPAVCIILCSNVRSLARNLSDLTVASSLWHAVGLRLFGLRYAIKCRSYLFPDLVSLSCCAGARSRGSEEWLHTYQMATEHFTNLNFRMVVANCWCLGSVVWDRSVISSVFTATLTYMTGFFTIY